MPNIRTKRQARDKKGKFAHDKIATPKATGRDIGPVIDNENYRTNCDESHNTQRSFMDMSLRGVVSDLKDSYHQVRTGPIALRDLPVLSRRAVANYVEAKQQLATDPLRKRFQKAEKSTKKQALRSLKRALPDHNLKKKMFNDGGARVLSSMVYQHKKKSAA